MAETNNYIKYIADLAKLSLNNEELESLAEDMLYIIGLMDTIKDIDTDNINATEHILSMTNNLREDNPGIPFEADKITANSKYAMENCYSIPKMIE